MRRVLARKSASKPPPYVGGCSIAHALRLLSFLPPLRVRKESILESSGIVNLGRAASISATVLGKAIGGSNSFSRIFQKFPVTFPKFS